MVGRTTNSKYEDEMERILNSMIDEHTLRVDGLYDEILRELKNELYPLYVELEGVHRFTKVHRKTVQDTVQRVVNKYHGIIRDEVKHSTNNAAVIGYSGVQYETEMTDRIKIPASAMALSILHDDYKKSKVHREYTAPKLSDGKNYADRVKRNHGQLIIDVTTKIGRGVTEAEGWIKLDKELSRSTTRVSARTKIILKNEAERVKEVAAINSVKDLFEVGVIKVKTWESREDSAVRMTHQALHGTTLKENEYFSTGNGQALSPRGFGVPSEDINCRCRLHYETAKIEDEGKFTKLTDEEDIYYDIWAEENGFHLEA